MKTFCLILMGTFFLTNSFAQDLESGGTNSWIFHTPDDGRTTMFVAPKIDGSYAWGNATQFWNNGNVSFSGNVGIGTVNPSGMLHINGSPITSSSGDVILTLQAAHSSATIGSGGLIKFTNNVEAADAAAIRTYTDGANRVSLRFQTGYGPGLLTDRMIISNSGNVGIGTSAPTEMLSVNGNIRSKEIKVENGNWPDYVFAKDYPLPTLQEIEKHIKDKGHLPGIPSAAEVKTNGIDLGEMNAKLMQKIEELTLHLIEMKKDNEDQKLSNLLQQKQIKAQQRDIEYLKSKLK